MHQFSMRHALLAVGLAAGLSGAVRVAHASPITLDTTWLDANGRLTLTADASETLGVTGISMSVGGKATTLSEGVFNLPISKLTTDIKLLPPSLNVLAAQAKGSSLDFTNTLKQAKASLSDLSMDFNTHTVWGDVLSASGKSHQSLFTFDVTAPLSFSLKGGISVNMTLSNLHFTDEGASSFAKALKVPDFLASALKQVDFGAIDARVVPWLRKALPDSSPLAVSTVPEPGSAALWYLGLAMAVMARLHASRRARREMAPLRGHR